MALKAIREPRITNHESLITNHQSLTKGTSSFLVPRDTPGLSVARCNETLGGRFMNNGEIVFEDCAVPKDHCLVENIALTRAGIYFRPGEIIVAAKNLGIGMAAFERTADYVQNYVQGGRILIKHQAVAIRLADMATTDIPDFYRRITGESTQRPGKSFGFVVSEDRERVFVHPRLMAPLNAAVGSKVECHAILGKDNQGKPGWRALRLKETVAT